MKIINKKYLGVLALSALAFGGLSYSALAYQGNYSQKGPNYSEERHALMTKAFEENDYNAWKSLMEGRGRAVEVITEDNFAKFSEARKLALEGKTEEANAIRAELGLRNGQGMRDGSGQGRGGMGRCAK